MTPRPPRPPRKMGPHIVAAGHMHIFAPKSGNSFPAFLIAGLTDFDLPAARDTCTKAGNLTCRWRTKRDLLLLSRAAKASAALLDNRETKDGSVRKTGGNNGEFPKSVYKKLADAAASCPWTRPIDTDDTRSPDQDEVQCLSALDEHDNGWKPEMIKSVRCLDSFLEKCQEIYERAVSEGHTVGKEHGDDKKLPPIIQGWRDFCRQGDAQGLIGGIESAGQKRPLAKTSSSLPIDPTTRAARLGQYFASEENAGAVVDGAIELARNAARKNDGTNGNAPAIVFIEPSCGDGRILERLLERLLSSPSDMANVCCVLGIDIDDRAVHACQSRVHQSNFDNAGTLPISIHQADFLELTRAKLQTHIAETSQGQEDDTVCIFLGGPPYTLGPLVDGAERNKESSKRGLDLPTRFLRHCMNELEGCGISFLLPERCETDAKTLCQELPRGWKFVNTKITESSFDFRGKMISQPSILQQWMKE